MSRFLFCCCLLSILGVLLRAGEPAARLQKITLAGENKDSLAELLLADRFVDPKHSAQALTAVAGLGRMAGPLGPVPAFALERISEQQWAEAMEEYQRLIDEEGDNLVPAGAAGPTSRSVQLRRLCQIRMAAAPPSALVPHQKRVAALADKLFREGQEKHDLRSLQRLVNDLFCSRPAGPALELLGDLAFEQGDFARALSWWRLLALPASDAERGTTGNALLIPDGPADPARIRAKQILALAFMGDRPRADTELKALERLHPKARGKLAGRDGAYAKIVEELIQGLPAEEVVDEPWTTFAGSPSRNRVSARSPSDRWWADGPAWRVSLVSEKDVVPRPGLKRSNRFYPVIVDDKVLVADDRTVTAYHLLTGKLLFRYDPFGPRATSLQTAHSFTLTVSAGRIYARLAQKEGKEEQSCLVCLEMIPDLRDKDKVSVRERWRVPAKDFVFGGAPVVHDGLAYIAQSQSADKRVRTSLCCYDAGSGKLRWREDICETPDQGGRSDSQILTLADEQLVFCHAGAIVAVDARTGKPKWGVRYLSRGMETKDGLLSPRELCPPVASEGRLFIAPADSERMFCLDCLTGQTLWDRGGIEVVHLLGTARGRLLFTTPQRLQAVMAATGLDQGGWLKPDVGTLPPMGRGLLAGDWVFWPTRDTKFPVRAVTQDQGEQEEMDPNRLRLLRPGNMVLGNGCLVVAGPDELVGYVSPQRLLEQRQTDASQPTASAGAVYLLAQSQAEAGQADLALANFKRVADSSDPEKWHGRPIQALALAERHALLFDLALRAEKRTAISEAAAFLQQAAGPEFPGPLRLRATIRLAEICEHAGQAVKAVAAWQNILLNESLRDGVFFSGNRAPQAAAILARARIQELIEKHGASVYADFEKQTRDAHDKGKGSSADLEKLVRAYPNASVVAAALAELAELEDKAGRFGAAAQTFRQLLRCKVDSVPALISLAQAYEKQRCHAAATATWRLLAEKHGDVRNQDRLVRELAADQLRKIEQRDASAKQQHLSFPLVQTWSYPSGDLLVPARNALSPNPETVFLASADRLSAHDVSDGKERWSRKLPFAPSWLGLHADLVLAAGGQGAAALRLQDGQPIWTFAPGKRDHRFAGFHLTTAHLFFLDDVRRLLAVELETGRVAWSQWAPGASFSPIGGGGFSPHFQAGTDWVMVQTSAGRRLVFHAATGKRLQESPSAAPWTQDPLLLDEQRLCLVERGRVVVLDSATWQEQWTYAPTWTTSWTGEALQVTCKGNCMLVLVPRNYGVELDRLDPSTGKSLWPQPCLLAHDRVDAQTISIADGCLFYVGDGTLTCRSMTDGKRVWHKPLTSVSRRWQTRHHADAVIAYSAEDRQPPWLWLPLGDMLLAVPTVHDFRSHPLAVSCHHAKDGRLLQRLDFTVPATRLDVQMFPDRLVVGAAGTACGLAVK